MIVAIIILGVASITGAVILIDRYMTHIEENNKTNACIRDKEIELEIKQTDRDIRSIEYQKESLRYNK